MMKVLPLTPEQLAGITREYPTPFYLYDEKAIREVIRRLKKAFSWNPGYREYFAVKATPNPYILDIFRDEGCGVDCASETELLLSGACGFQGMDIMFTSNATTVGEYQMARSLDAIINLDDTGHAGLLESNAGIPELICCRYNPGIKIQYDGKVIINFEEQKFGSTKAQITACFSRLKDKGVKRFGIHAQYGAHRREADHFGNNASILFELAVDIFREPGIKVDFINFAGGVGIPYKPEDGETDIEAISDAIRKAYEKTIVRSGLHPVDVFTELGLYMTGPHGYFVTSVLHVKETYKRFAALDASTNAFMSPCRYQDYHQITVVGRKGEVEEDTYDLTGGLCEARDRFAINRRLPRLSPGDLIVFHDAGAYCYSHSNNFNGKLRPAELLLCADGSIKLIRRAERPEDYFATLDYPWLK